MSRWEQQLNNHPIHQTLRELRSCIEKDYEEADENELAERRRFGKVLTLFEDSIGKLDPEVTPFNQLDALNNNLRHQNIFQNATNYRDARNRDSLTTANTHLSNQLTTLALLLSVATGPLPPPQLGALEAEVEQFATKLAAKHRELTNLQSGLTADQTSLKADIQDSRSALTKLRDEINAQLSQWQQQFSADQDSRQKEHNAIRQKAEEQITSWSNEFNNSQNAREKSFKEVVQKLETKYDSLIQDKHKAITSELDDLFAKASAEAEKLLSTGRDKHQEILELHSLVASDSVAAGYMQTARTEGDAANRWRLTSVGFIVATAIWVAVALFSDVTAGADGSIKWTKAILSLSLTGVLLFGAAYSAQQSTRHRTNEKRTRWFALEVKAIDPFISSLPPEDQQALKKSLSERLFGRESADEGRDGTVVDEHALGLVVKAVTDIFKSVPR